MSEAMNREQMIEEAAKALAHRDGSKWSEVAVQHPEPGQITRDAYRKGARDVIIAFEKANALAQAVDVVLAPPPTKPVADHPWSVECGLCQAGLHVTQNGSCWDRAPDGFGPMTPLCELKAGHLGAHRGGTAQWIHGTGGA